MSANDSKKYYWLKLQDDFFKRHDIKIIESMPNGKDYIIFYLKLLCESTSHEGRLRFSDEIPYDEKMLATITNTNIDIVRSAITLLNQLKMIEILDDGTYYMRQVSKMIGSETGSAMRKRNYRENQPKLLEGTIGGQCLQEIDIDIEKDKDIDISIPKGIECEWKAYKEMRKKIKSPMTEYAEQLALKKLFKLSDDEETQKQIINQSILNSWKGLFPLKEKHIEVLETYDSTNNPYFSNEKRDELLRRRENEKQG